MEILLHTLEKGAHTLLPTNLNDKLQHKFVFVLFPEKQPGGL